MVIKTDGLRAAAREMSWKAVHLENPLNRRVGLLLSEATHFVDLAN